MNMTQSQLSYDDDGFGAEALNNFINLCERHNVTLATALPYETIHVQYHHLANPDTQTCQAGTLHPQINPVDESYTIATADNTQTITISGRSETGIFRALCTLASDTEDSPSNRATTGSSTAYKQRESSPAYAWRGLSLDVARYKASLQEIEDVIDILALHNMSVLHIHLTDHQSWRIPIEGFALLEQSQDCFSWDDFNELKEYASRRYITLVPEIDMPGHCAMLLQQYPELSAKPAFPHPFVSYINTHTDRSHAFLRACAHALSKAASGLYVHIGGDEVLGMPESDYDEAMTLLHDAVHAYGLKTIAWQEACRSQFTADAYQFWMGAQDVPSEHNLIQAWPKEFSEVARKAAAMYALCYDDPQRLAAKASPVVDSQQSWLYLDRKYSEPSLIEQQNKRMQTLGFPGYEAHDSSDCLNWIPLNTPEKQTSLSSGGTGELSDAVEAALWTETVKSQADMMMLMLPRLAMIADIAWDGAPTSAQQHHMNGIAPNVARKNMHYARLWQRFGFNDYYRSSSLFSSLE